jgi:hypothetical protein
MIFIVISKCVTWRISFGLLILLMVLPSCAPQVKKPASVPWHSVYRSIDDAQAHQFLNSGVKLLTQTHGSPEIPVNKVILRHSVKNEASSRYRVSTGFTKMEVADRQRGVFCIYLAVPPSHERFYYLLGHEIGHLLRPDRVGSAEEERFCNEFSRKLCAQENRPWSDKWETRDWVRLD